MENDKCLALEKGTVVPKECKYIDASGYIYEEGEYLPTNSKANDRFISADYIYCLSNPNEGWSVTVRDDSKEYFESLYQCINGILLSNMDYTFFECRDLIESPMIPSTVKSLNGTYTKCITLSKAPYVPKNVTSIHNLFDGCESLKGDVIIDGCIDMSNKLNYSDCFKGCANNRNYSIILHGLDIVIKEIKKSSYNPYISIEK